MILNSKPEWECRTLGWSIYNLHVEEMWIARRKNRRDSKSDHNFPLQLRNGVSFLIHWLNAGHMPGLIQWEIGNCEASINMKRIYICFFWNILLCEWDQIKWLNERGHVAQWPCFLAAVQLTSWNRSVELTRHWQQMNEWDQFRPAENYQTESSWNSQNQAVLNTWLLTSRN